MLYNEAISQVHISLWLPSLYVYVYNSDHAWQLKDSLLS